MNCYDFISSIEKTELDNNDFKSEFSNIYDSMIALYKLINTRDNIKIKAYGNNTTGYWFNLELDSEYIDSINKYMSYQKTILVGNITYLIKNIKVDTDNEKYIRIEFVEL